MTSRYKIITTNKKTKKQYSNTDSNTDDKRCFEFIFHWDDVSILHETTWIFIKKYNKKNIKIVLDLISLLNKFNDSKDEFDYMTPVNSIKYIKRWNIDTDEKGLKELLQSDYISKKWLLYGPDMGIATLKKVKIRYIDSNNVRYKCKLKEI